MQRMPSAAALAPGESPPRGDTDPPPRPTPRLIGARYQLINEIGHGGMGSVYRALDRVTGGVVTLKRLRVPSGPNAERDSREGRVMLAQEFRLLASLRHPNIVSVLAYGFDDEQQPYFTMDLEEGARPITRAGAAQALALQVELLVQLLRALAYLHRHGIVHRDLKPENILVVRDQVKVLDFGLSIHAVDCERAGWAGTLHYMAPEVLRGEAPSGRCDLYAFGMVAYELMTGSYPFPASSPAALSQDILCTPLPRPADPIDPRLRPILRRLLAKSPGERYGEAGEVIAALAAALDLPLVTETVVTRESFLQSAPLVGRDGELALLTDRVRAARHGEGGTLLVAGESGVGKSRLLDEVRTQALVEGLLVVRGQAMRDGGGPYHSWREVVGNLVLRTDPTDADAGVLKAVVPDVAELLGHDIPDPAGLDIEAAQLRLLAALEQLLRQQPGPVLVILEDLQWAGSESLKIFGWLAQAVARLPVLLLGSYRDEEAPHLREHFAGIEVLTLGRLDAPAMTALVESMIGDAARRPDVMGLLARETEGIPFFIVEAVRALAESAGALARIGTSGLPKRVISGGMQKVVRRRLDRVPKGALTALRTAAVVARTIDARIMRAVHPELVLDEWLMCCAEAGVLEVRDQQWRFAHDKLREQLLDDLSPAWGPSLHGEVADAIEREYPGREEYVVALAHHWQQAGEPAKEADYAARAGVLALQSGACQEAVVHLSRALELLRMLTVSQGSDQAPPVRRRGSVLDPNAGVDPDGAEFRLGRVETWLTEAHFGLGDLAACTEHAERALRHFGQHVPSRTLGWALDIVRQAALIGLQVLSGVRPVDPARSRRVATEIAKIQSRLIETSVYSLRMAPLLWSTLRQVNHCRPAGLELELAQAYLILGFAAGSMTGPRLLDRWSRRALETVERTGTARDLACILSRIASHDIGQCRWDAADAHVTRAIASANDVGDLRLWAECHAQAGAVAHYSGRFERGLRFYADTHRLSRRGGNQQIECWALFGQADLLLRLGRTEEALALYEEGIQKLDARAMRSETIWGFGMAALARLRAGDEAGAHDAADRALSHIVQTTPIAYWTQQGMAATAEVLLLLLEATPSRDAESRSQLIAGSWQACRSLGMFARRFPLGRPHAQLWYGLFGWLEGRPRRALRLWQRAIDRADALGTPYERARAHLEIGRHLGPERDDRRHHLFQAVDLFEKLGAAADVARARAELQRTPDARA